MVLVRSGCYSGSAVGDGDYVSPGTDTHPGTFRLRGGLVSHSQRHWWSPGRDSSRDLGSVPPQGTILRAALLFTSRGKGHLG